MKLSNNFSRIFVLDKIRISKLLQIFQSSIIALLLSIYLGTILDDFLDKYIFADYENIHKKPVNIIILEITIQFMCIIFISYYIGNVVKTIPFLISLTNKYISNKKGEISRGISIGTKVVFFMVQHRLTANIKELSKRVQISTI